MHKVKFPIDVDQPPGCGVLVGEAWVPGDKDMPYKASNPLPTLDFKNLSSLQLSYVITRPDDNKQIWEILSIPRKREGHNKFHEFHQLGHVLENICAMNNDLPPISTAQDFHGSHLFIQMMFLGILNHLHFVNVAFFKHCTARDLSSHIPYFIYMVLFYKSLPIFNHGETCKHDDLTNVEILSYELLKKTNFDLSIHKNATCVSHCEPGCRQRYPKITGAYFGDL